MVAIPPLREMAGPDMLQRIEFRITTAPVLTMAAPARSAKVQLTSVDADEDSLYIAAPVFQLKTQLVSDGDEVRLNMPPPLSASLPTKEQLRAVGLEESLYIPPPKLTAELPPNLQLISVGEAAPFAIPPPNNAEFVPKVQLVSVGDEEEALSIPPPKEAA